MQRPSRLRQETPFRWFGYAFLPFCLQLGCSEGHISSPVSGTQDGSAADAQPVEQVSPAVPPTGSEAGWPASTDAGSRTTTTGRVTELELDAGTTAPVADAQVGSDSGALADTAGDAETDANAVDADAADNATQPGAITVWIAGDSTVARGNTPCPRGWGAEIGAFFDERVTVVNSAVGGRSVRTWLYDVHDTFSADGECARRLEPSGEPALQERWVNMLDGMAEGDYLLIQFGINDGDTKCPRHVGTAAFQDEYAMMAEAALARGTQPVFLTPVSALRCEGASAVGTRGFVSQTFDVSQQLEVPVIDLHGLSVALYNELGFCPLPTGHSDVSASTPGEVGAFFCEDHTHFDTPGAQAIAAQVAQALAEQGLGLADYLRSR